MGIWSALGDLASKGLDKAADTHVGAAMIDTAGTKAMEYSRSPQGQIIGKLVDKFHAEQAQSLSKLDAPHSALIKGIQDHPVLRNQIKLDSTPLQKITNQLRASGSPLAIISDQLERQTPDNYTKTLKQIHDVNIQQARLTGITNSFGDKMQNVVPHIMDLQDHPDPRMNMHAQRLLDNISATIHDTISIKAPKGGMMDVSKGKADVADALTKVNKFRQAQINQGNKDVQLLKPEDIKLAPVYKLAGPKEKAVSNWIRMVQVPLVAIPHLSGYFNIGATSSLKSMGDALLGMNDKQMQDAIYRSGALSATMHDMMHSFIEGRTGIVSKIPFLGPTAGELLYKGMHTPGFNYLREKQLWLAAATGYHSVIDWGAAAAKGDKLAISKLGEIGINAKSVAARGGVLNPKELQDGIFHFTNDRLFIARSQDQPLNSSRNAWARSAYMYHSFLNSQVTFMRRNLDRMVKNKDIMGIAQFAGTLGVLFPLVAPLLKSLEVLGRTASPKQAGQSIHDDYDKLKGNQGLGAAALEYADLLCHIGGMGVYMNYMSAAANHRMQSAVLGPLYSTPFTAVEDLAASYSENKKTGQHNIKPFARDILQDTLPVIGKPLSHMLAPTNKEAPKVRLSRRGRRRY